MRMQAKTCAYHPCMRAPHAVPPASFPTPAATLAIGGVFPEDVHQLLHAPGGYDGICKAAPRRGVPQRVQRRVGLRRFLRGEHAQRSTLEGENPGPWLLRPDEQTVDPLAAAAPLAQRHVLAGEDDPHGNADAHR